MMKSTLPPAAPNKLLPWLLLIVAGVPWGATFVLSIMALDSGGHPFAIAFWQALAGVVMLLVLNAFRRRPLLPVNAFYLRFYVVCGALGTALPSVFYFYAAQHLQAGVLSIALATVPMATFGLAWALRMEAFAVLRMVGLALGGVAILMLTVPETSLPDPGAWFWVLIAVIASSFYAFENIYIGKYLPEKDDPFMILTGMMSAGVLLLLPAIVVTDVFYLPPWPLDAPTWAIIGMAAVNVMSYGLFILLIRIAGPVFASQMGYIVTLAGVAWGIAIFSEQHSLWFWGALVTMLIGLAFVQPRKGDEAEIAAVAHPGDHAIDQFSGRDDDASGSD